MFNFEKLETWHEAIAFADLIYRVSENFPRAERFGLTDQMRRAAVSVSSNVAEGCSRSSRADYDARSGLSGNHRQESKVPQQQRLPADL